MLCQLRKLRDNFWNSDIAESAVSI